MAAKKPKAKMSADRLADLKRTQTRAGNTKSTMATRAKQNQGVKDGTIRIGKNGKSYNVYDAKTATWKRGVVKPAATASRPTTRVSPSARGEGSGGGAKASSGGDFERWFKQTYPGVPYPGLAAGKAKAKRDGKGKQWWQAGGGGIVGSNK
jgi:hypothetical protein